MSARCRLRSWWTIATLGAWLVTAPQAETRGQADQSAARGTYFGQTPPGTRPEVFAPGIISPDGRFLFFSGGKPPAGDIYRVSASVLGAGARRDRRRRGAARPPRVTGGEP